MKYVNLNTIVFVLLLALPNFGFSQKEITLDSCFVWAEANYPLVAKYALVDQSAAFTIENASTGYLPRVSIYGKASYQSDVTSLPFEVPNVLVEPLSPNQYNLFGEVYQPLTGVIGISNEKALAEANADAQKQSVAVAVYQLNQRVIDIYFGILMLDEQLIEIELVRSDITSGLKRMEAAIANGTALRSAKDALLAEEISVAQREIQINTNRQAYLDMLGLFVGQALTAENVKLRSPKEKVMMAEVNRPELELFEMQNRGLEIQNQLISDRNIPELGLFFRGGYGRPGLNFLSNDFELYYVGGATLKWNLSRFYTTKNQREILDVNRMLVEADRSTFLFNTQMAARSQLTEMGKYDQLIEKDVALIEIRERIKATSNSQLEYGTITPTDYLIHINAAEKARQDLAMHRLQRLKTAYEYGFTTGNN